ncbi:hypothetical protein ACIQNU_17980 [Streptomyces sp. NPDC091292]|uniref:hypothetical protein n=1 Tax=Streptomyces sp. NPDC091292 TaxID=3365991 RepID=UPI0037FDDE34
MTNDDASYSERIFESSLEGFPHTLQGIGTIAKNTKVYGAGVAVNGAVGIKQIADEAGRYLHIHRHPIQESRESQEPNYYQVGSGIVNTAGAVIYGASSAGALSSTLGGVGAIAQGLSYYAAKFLPRAVGEFNDSSFSRKMADASREGFPLILQGIGTVTDNLTVYGAGIAVNGLVGLQQVVNEAERCLKIYWHPNDAHPKPNYYRMGSGFANMAGAAVYGAYSAGILGPVAGGVGAITQGMTYYATNLLPQDAGNYCPPLPVHNSRTADPEALLHQMPAHSIPRPATAPGSTAMAEVAALRVAGYENHGPREGSAEAHNASKANQPYVRTAVNGNSAHHSRRATI